MLDVQPLGGRVILKPSGVPVKIGRIFVPGTSKEMEANEGTVLAIGDECQKLVEGDYVIYGKYAGFMMERNGEDFYMLNECDILGVIDRAKMNTLNLVGV